MQYEEVEFGLDFLPLLSIATKTPFIKVSNYPR